MMHYRTSRAQSRSLADSKRQGFTLVELLVQIVILVIIAAFVASSLGFVLKRQRELAASRNGPEDLRELCEIVRRIIRDPEKPLPEDLASIIDELPDDFEVITEDDGTQKDVSAHGFRYRLLVRKNVLYDRYYRQRIGFTIYAIPSTFELINKIFSIEVRPWSDLCILSEKDFSQDADEDRTAYLEELAMQFTSSAMASAYSPEDVAENLFSTDQNIINNVLGLFVDSNNDGEVTLKELKDLEEMPLVGGYVQTWSDFFAIGVFGEEIDKIGAPVASFQFNQNHAEFLSEYHGLSGRLKLELPSPEVQSIAASVDAAQLAADDGDLSREQKQIDLIREKGRDAWLRDRLSTEVLNFLEYSLKVRESYLVLKSL